MAKEYSLSFTAANVYALALFVPILAILLIPYGSVYGWNSITTDLVQFISNVPLALVSILLGTVLHELIHALCWVWLDEIPWSGISFGVKWKVLTPYVHCPEPVEVSNYRWGVAMPGIILGIAPYLLALLLQNGWLLGFGVFFTLAAGGDILILLLLRHVEKGQRVKDHPDHVGCRLVE